MIQYSCDVLVVGGGGAGLMSACESAETGAKTILVSKGRAGRSGATAMAPGAFASVGDFWKEEGDSRQCHFEDTVEGGAHINDPAMVRRLCEDAPALTLKLEAMGSLFERSEDGAGYALRTDGGHRHHRSPYLEDRTGREMLKGMLCRLDELGVQLLEEIMICRIITENGRVKGAVGWSFPDSEAVQFTASSVILATGGGGELYENTDNPTDVTGDGYALALGAGAVLQDMEFVQFYPVGMLNPPSLRGAMGALMYYSRLYNARGERFMEKYDPERLEMSTRDLVSRAILTEVREGRGTPGGGVWCDMTYHEPGFLQKAVPGMYAMYRRCGFDPEKERFEVAPTCHFFMGGVSVKGDWQSPELSGLFAAGETCGGMHGANRLSQNALTELLVSGHHAGQNAASYAKKHPAAAAQADEAEKLRDRILLLRSRKEGISPSAVRRQIKRIMWEKAGVIRSRTGLEDALRELKALSETPVCICGTDTCCRDLLLTLENENMFVTAEAVIRSALAREKSRGAHFRSDCPGTGGESWLKHICVSSEGLSTRPLRNEYEA